MPSQEDQVNQIRNNLASAIKELWWLKPQSGACWPRIQDTAVLLETIVVDFERLVKEMPVEMRSSQPLKTEWLGFEKSFP